MARTRQQTQDVKFPDADGPAAVPATIEPTPTPDAAGAVARPLEEPAAPPPVRFDFVPRTVELPNTSGPSHVLVCWPSDPASRDQFSRLLYDAPRRLEVALLAVRERFFTDGPGAELRAREAKYADAERAVKDSESAIMGLRVQWKMHVRTGLDVDVSGLEQQIDERERALTRQKERVAVLGEALGQQRKDAANQLHALLLEAVDQFEEDRGGKVATLTAKLREVVAPIYRELIEAALEAEGVHGVKGSKLRLLASSAHAVPRSERSAVPGTLPELVFQKRTEDEARAVVAARPHPANGPLRMGPVPSEPHLDRRPGDVVMLDGIRMIVGADGYLEAAPRAPEPVPTGGGELWPGEFAGCDDE